MPAERNDPVVPAGVMVITGANGSVGRLLRAHLPAHIPLRLVARNPDAPIHPNEHWVAGDLSDREFAESVMADAASLVHLAGNPSTASTWKALASANIEMLTTVLEAAVAAGVPHIVNASSVHVLGLYNRPAFRPVHDALLPRPCCMYGATKAIGESIAARLAEESGIPIANLRLGAVVEQPEDRDSAEVWLGGEDLAALVLAALTPPTLAPAYLAVSGDATRRWSVAKAATDLGYRSRSRESRRYSDLPDHPIDNDVCAFRVAALPAESAD